MAGLTNDTKGTMLAAFGGIADHVSLHSADPGTNGASEISGGSYARKSVAWATPSSGSMVSSGQVVFNVASGVTITHLGYWSEATGGTFYGSRALNASQTFGSAGTYTIAAGSISEAIS
jgi:hypothetical protein